MTTTLDRQDTQWFASWFDSPHYHRLYAHRSTAEAAGFIDALIDRLRPETSASALDLGCGAGRHARQLASRGLRVTGLDLAASSIREAKRFERPNLRFARHDMRRPFGTHAYDYVFNFFTSFGYFDGPTEHEAVLRNMATALTPNGQLVIDYLNVAYADRRSTPDETQTIDGVEYRITRWTDRDHFFKRIAIADPLDGERRPYEERVARFRLADFQRMFGPLGLRIERVYGDYALNAYDEITSPRLILMARRTAPAISWLSRAS